MKKFLLSLAAAVMTVPVISASSITLQISDPDNWFNGAVTEHVAVWNTANWTKYETSNPMTIEYEGELKLQIEFWLVDEVGTQELHVNPQSGTAADFNATGAGLIKNLGVDGAYLTVNDNADGQTFTILVYEAGKNPEAPEEVSEVSMNFNIVAAQGASLENPYEYINISYFDNVNEDTWGEHEVTLSSNSATATIPVNPFAGTSVSINPAAGYMVSAVTASDASANFTVSEDADLEGGWVIYVPGKPNTSTITYTVEVKMAPPSIYMNFVASSENIYNNPQDFVTVSATSGSITLPDTENKVYFPNDGASNLTFTISPVTNYLISDVTIVDSATDTTVPMAGLAEYGSTGTDNGDGTYSFDIAAAAKGLVFTFVVEDTLPSTDITFTFSSQDASIAAPYYSYLENIVAGLSTAITPESDTFAYPYKTPNQTLDILFVPKEGYLIEVACYTLSNGESYGTVTADNSFKNAYTLSIEAPYDEAKQDYSNIPSDLVVTVKVSIDPSSGVASIVKDNGEDVIYNLNGVRVDKASKGIYIVNGKKVIVK